MDQIWGGKSFEDGGHWPLWHVWKNEKGPRRADKSRTLKIKKIKTVIKRFFKCI